MVVYPGGSSGSSGDRHNQEWKTEENEEDKAN